MTMKILALLALPLLVGCDSSLNPTSRRCRPSCREIFAGKVAGSCAISAWTFRSPGKAATATFR